MKRLLLIFTMLFGGLCILSAGPVEDLEQIYREGQKLEGVFPRPHGKADGPKCLILAGGRPWVGNNLGKAFALANMNVQLLNSCYLGGQGGSFIRITPSESFEPTPVNAIPGEFARLSQYKLVVILGIPNANQKNILTPERRKQLLDYVRQGGCLLLGMQTPSDFKELLPVELGQETSNTPGMYVLRPASPAFSLLPERWAQVDPYRKATLRQGSKVLANIHQPDGTVAAPLLATRSIGQGKVLFFNGDYTRRQTNSQFFIWAYTNYLLQAMGRELTGLPCLKVPLPVYRDVVPPKQLATAVADPEIPSWGIQEDNREILLQDKTLLFPNGYRLKIYPGKRRMDLMLPGSTDEDTPILSRITAPVLQSAAKQVEVEASTAEATNVKSNTFSHNIRWKCKGIQGGKIAQIHWVSQQGDELLQEFKCGTVTVDGVPYTGIAQRIRLIASQRQLAAFSITGQMQRQPGKIRRNACYAAPRGYAEYDMNATAPFKTCTWDFFSNGQPFSWVELTKSNLVYVDFPELPDSLASQFDFTGGEESPISHTITFKLGYRSAPVETQFVWQVFGPADKTANDNGWMAFYQFVRHHLRTAIGFPEIPAYPQAAFKDTATQAEKEETIRKMGLAGFTYCALPYCPSNMDQFDNPKRTEDFKLITDAGMIPYPWTPCGHSIGSPAGAKNLQEWFARTPDNKVYSYFGGHYDVADQSNPDYLAWYLPKMKEQMDKGVLAWWFDMGGSAADTVNYAKLNSGIGLTHLIKIYRFLYENGAKGVVTEGANPLSLDGYIYRPKDYTPMKGREYVFHSALLANDSGGLDFDFFRNCMFGTFYAMAFDNYNTGFETLVYEQKKLNEVVHYLPGITRILDAVGMPFIRITPYGTTWISATGAAVFCYDSVKDLKVSLPEGYEAVGMATETSQWVPLDGQAPAQVAPRTMILFQKRSVSP